MNIPVDSPLAKAVGRRPFGPRPAPSLRVPVTAGNRDLLRRLRAAELSAWRDADAKPRRSFRIRVDEFATEPFFRLNVNCP